ncbi:toll/interleukin-1 receptor domain-containing protein [Methylomonas sp. SURF-1]|uniref:Toll/interleukin-1 receptor domain-containing protein n=1 Tax=Methylomonas aurea TaxID=2952224 RepID=A0ABT1UMC0_9GAMM|nr:toll/interleukin-1 receptor domain-containing protein [Methylomonas sp. SURF-1]MCQ8183375.1 toll/interleukin-1 receptor domain-containing protein [Methylomonas sp. SURF-1]
MHKDIKSWDVFISHATEDKDLFVRPLAITLQNLGVSVWYDEFTLRLGNSLRKSIDKGLASCQFGLIVISQHFIKKKWPEYELNGLISREIDEDRVILPIWHGVNRQQVVQFSPTLADKLALNTEGQTAQDIAIQVFREVRPDLYATHPRAEIERIASREALRDLQQEFDRIKEELSEYQCPYCGASLQTRLDAPFDDEQKHWGVREIFECGYQVFGSSIERLCSTDPRFPKFDEYELRFYNTPDKSHWQWACFAVAKTEMARLFELSASHGRTKEEAETKMRENYQRYAKNTE